MAKPGTLHGPTVSGFANFVQEVELGRTARADANDGFDAVSFRLADQFAGLCPPPLEDLSYPLAVRAALSETTPGPYGHSN
jgi:hypothetical protein